jgi:hypothetical protein
MKKLLMIIIKLEISDENDHKRSLEEINSDSQKFEYCIASQFH